MKTKKTIRWTKSNGFGQTYWHSDLGRNRKRRGYIHLYAGIYFAQRLGPWSDEKVKKFKTLEEAKAYCEPWILFKVY